MLVVLWLWGCANGGGGCDPEVVGGLDKLVDGTDCSRGADTATLATCCPEGYAAWGWDVNNELLCACSADVSG